MHEATFDPSLMRMAPEPCPRTRARRRCVILAVTYIEAGFRDPISLEDIAKAAHVSKFHFARTFRAEIAMSPMQYVRWRRVQEAKRLLRTGRAPLAAIATDLGYFDHSHFTRAFRSATGLRPNEYLATVSGAR